MDDELRRLERAARAGDPQAAAAYDARLARLGLGWWGEELPDGVARGSAPCHYRFPGLDVELELVCRREDRRLVAVLTALPGAPDAPALSLFATEQAQALVDCGYRWALVDLAPVVTIGSSAVGLQLIWIRQFRRAGGGLGCFGGRPLVAQTFELLGMIEELGWAPTRDEALARL